MPLCSRRARLQDRFHDAATVFADPLSKTFPDPDHSEGERRFLNSMKKKKTETPQAAERDELRPEYDFATMKGGVRGKYIERYRAGTNLAEFSRLAPPE